MSYGLLKPYRRIWTRSSIATPQRRGFYVLRITVKRDRHRVRISRRLLKG